MADVTRGFGDVEMRLLVVGSGLGAVIDATAKMTAWEVAGPLEKSTRGWKECSETAAMVNVKV